MADETVLVAGFSHETNTFAPTSTTRADFQERREYFGEEVITDSGGPTRRSMERSMSTGTENHLGRTVLLQCGPEDGVALIVTENRLQPLNAEIWRHVGVQPERLDVVVVKSANHYRADYEPMASHVVPINSPGLAAMDP